MILTEGMGAAVPLLSAPGFIDLLLQISQMDVHHDSKKKKVITYIIQALGFICLFLRPG